MSTLTQLANLKSQQEHDFLSRESVKWLQKQTQNLNKPSELAREIGAEKSRYGGKFVMGGLYHFFYDPIGKKQLPYYDVFPLVIPLKKDGTGFIGLNLHYLPVRMRANFLDKLRPLAVLNDNDEIKRLRVTYEILSTMRRFIEYTPCIKRYSLTQVRSKILSIKPNEWEVALFLPTENFKKATKEKVFKESVQKIQESIKNEEE